MYTWSIFIWFVIYFWGSNYVFVLNYVCKPIPYDGLTMLILMSLTEIMLSYWGIICLNFILRFVYVVVFFFEIVICFLLYSWLCFDWIYQATSICNIYCEYCSSESTQFYSEIRIIPRTSYITSIIDELSKSDCNIVH